MAIKINLLSVIVASVMLMTAVTVKANPVDSILSDCMACHAVSEPSEMTLDERMTRIGPSLFYAGNKYQAIWLEKWLQNPTRLFPAGVYYGQYAVVTDEGDIVNQDDLVEHPKLDAEQAKEATQALLELKAKSDLVADIIPGEIKKVSHRMGALNFKKFKGCASCHQDVVGEGGVSGPELYTAFDRLQLTYLISYMINPKDWEPRSLMPNLSLKQKDIEKLVGYLKTIAEDEP